MEVQFESWSARLEELATRFDKAGGSDFRQRIADLKVWHAAAQQKLEDLRSAEAEQWERCRTHILVAWNELENAINDLQQSLLEKGEEARRHPDESEESSRRRGRSLRPGKRICTTAEAESSTRRGSSEQTGAKAALTHDQVAARAYCLWTQKGRTSGKDE
jgi:hypothetical protein